MSSKTRQQLEEWLGTIKIDAMSTILDVGGSQNPISGRVKTIGEGSAVEILDLETPHESKQEPDIIIDIEQNLSLSLEMHKQYDVAFCIEVSEYWIDPLKALKNIRSLLKMDGYLYISFHMVYPLHNPQFEDSLRYTEYGVRKLLERSGFKVEEFKYREGTGLHGYYLSEGMRPAKIYSHHDAVGFLVKARAV